MGEVPAGWSPTPSKLQLLVATRVEGTLGNPTKVTFVDAKGIRRTTLDVDADWWPGQPVWTGMVHGKPVSVQVRAILNGYDLAYRGIRTKAYVYTEREAALAALMPEKAAPDTSKLLLCPMPGLVKAIHVAAGQEVKAGEALCVVEAMKMENIMRAEREASRPSPATASPSTPSSWSSPEARGRITHPSSRKPRRSRDCPGSQD